MLKMLRFKSSVSFGTHLLDRQLDRLHLLDRQLRVLKLPIHLSKLTANH